MMFTAVASPFLVPYHGGFLARTWPTKTDEIVLDKKAYEKEMEQLGERVDEAQRMLYAQDQYSVLLIFQALDAAGKDGTIRAVTRGINPAGCQVFSFKQPSKEELDHDFLWRTTKRLPERGRIGIFNRSYYEEVLVVRVHPEYLDYQKLPDATRGDELWQQRYHSIRQHEEHLARNGTIILKFWLNVSRDEQRRRFLARIDTPEKHWKFAAGDVAERRYWEEYMDAYQDALSATSRPWAPWYAIPADDKRAMRVSVARVLTETLESLNLSYPVVSDSQRDELKKMRAQLVNEGDTIP